MKKFAYVLLILYTILLLVDIAFFIIEEINTVQFVIFLISYVLFALFIMFSIKHIK
jgi:hypothetical protein